MPFFAYQLQYHMRPQNALQGYILMGAVAVLAVIGLAVLFVQYARKHGWH